MPPASVSRSSPSPVPTWGSRAPRNTCPLVWHTSAYGGSGNKAVWALCTDVDLGDASLGAPLIDASGHVIATIGPVPCWAYNDPDGDHASSTAGSAMAINGVQR